jgi:hypothetical protein
MGILASRIPANQIESATKSKEGIAVRAERHVIITPLKPTLAKELRGDKLTDDLRIHKRGSKEHKAAGVALKEKMEVAVQKALAEDSNLVAAMDSMWGEDMRRQLWTMIADWYNHDIVRTKLAADQVRYVD